VIQPAVPVQPTLAAAVAVVVVLGELAALVGLVLSY
jgi:hypothetical protein